ncbi:MAG: CopG family transcriptional regulator [Nitrospiraceae bacterium]|nr:MAG: CopG family transcriptional regulator [Nitrospiraceae bacterium]
MERQNLTLSLPRAIVKKAKMLALKEEKSLSALIRESLEDKIRKDTGYQDAMKREIKLMEQGLHLGTGGHMPCSREELHERR